MCCEFLPPYSPDYNPIELLFSAMKYRLRHNGDYVRFTMTDLPETEIHSTLTEAVCDITQQDTFGWYRHCGYV
jgi:transposase